MGERCEYLGKIWIVKDIVAQCMHNVLANENSKCFLCSGLPPYPIYCPIYNPNGSKKGE